MKLHFHDWSRWGAVIINHDGKKCQYRYCTVCNKADYRLWWDGQTDLNQVTETLKEIEE